jgi:hypothetical protein
MVLAQKSSAGVLASFRNRFRIRFEPEGSAIHAGRFKVTAATMI